MLAIEIELLSGRYAATAHNDRERAEWPPHPARFFSALVAALHYRWPESESPGERAALLWLEQQGAPSLDVNPPTEEGVGRRDVRDVFVPVNDVSLIAKEEKAVRDVRDRIEALAAQPSGKETEAALRAERKTLQKVEKKLVATLTEIDPEPADSELKTAAALLPDRRTRQVRTFPVAIPARSTFAFVWPDSDSAQHRVALSALCERVTRLGHSSSLVRCALTERASEPTLVPTDDARGSLVLRIVGPGQLELLEREHARHRGVESRVLPARPQRYGRPHEPGAPEPRMSVFSDEWIVFERVDGARPLSSRGTDLTRALRASFIEADGTGSLPSWISGHRGDGSAATTPHAAFVAIPFVGHRHADASIQGCAVVIPREIERRARETLFRLVAQLEHTRGDSDGTLSLAIGTLPPVRVRRTELSAKKSLDTEQWCRASRRFVTVTPIALDRNPGNLRSNVERSAQRAAILAQESIADACEHIGLPRPVSVEISSTPLLPGVQPARQFLPWPPQKSRPQRVRVHAAITFGEAVRGPVLLGAGRYFGLGLCLPVRAIEGA